MIDNHGKELKSEYQRSESQALELNIKHEQFVDGLKKSHHDGVGML